MASSIQVPLVFPYTRVIDFRLGHLKGATPRGLQAASPSGASGASGASPLAFSLMMDMDASSAVPGLHSILQSNLIQAGHSSTPAQTWSYTFVVDNRDDLFLWVRGLSMALEKAGSRCSKYTVADIHAALSQGGDQCDLPDGGRGVADGLITS